jgi:hypothetical protein
MQLNLEKTSVSAMRWRGAVGALGACLHDALAGAPFSKESANVEVA